MGAKFEKQNDILLYRLQIAVPYIAGHFLAYDPVAFFSAASSTTVIQHPHPAIFRTAGVYQQFDSLSCINLGKRWGCLAVLLAQIHPIDVCNPHPWQGVHAQHDRPDGLLSFLEHTILTVIPVLRILLVPQADDLGAEPVERFTNQPLTGIVDIPDEAVYYSILALPTPADVSPIAITILYA